MDISEKDKERFFRHTRRDPATGCLLWTGAKDENGYGWFRLGGKTYRAHAVALAIAGRPVPPGANGMHNCPAGDNPSCCEESHLLVGTPKEHRADMEAKGQLRIGEVRRTDALADARAYIARRKAEEQEPAFRSAHLQADLRLGWNLASSILEELEAAGELVKKPQRDGNVWVPSPAAQPVGRGYALPLSQKEASALLRALDLLLDLRTGGEVLRETWKKPGDLTTLREVRSRLKGGPL